MEDRYEIRLYDWGGRLLSVLDTWRSLSVNNKINGISNHTLSLDANDPNVPFFVKDYFVEVRRRNDLLGWYIEYQGFHRTPRRQITATGQEVFTSYGRSFEDLLRRRSLCYFAPYGRFGDASSVMKTMVLENCGGAATLINGRLHTGVFPNFSIDPPTGVGPFWSGERTYKNLLDVLQEISLATDTDFAVTTDNLLGHFLFKTYNPLGSDRAIVFSPEFGNVSNPDYTVSATEEYNTVIVTGTGQGTARDVEISSTPAVSDTPWNNIELVRDARNEDALASVIAAELEKGAAKTAFSFDVIQTPTSIYGRDYELGDYVTIRMGDVIITKRILGVDILVNESENSLKFDFGDNIPTPHTPNAFFAQSIINLSKRIQTIEHSGPI